MTAIIEVSKLNLMIVVGEPSTRIQVSKLNFMAVLAPPAPNRRRADTRSNFARRPDPTNPAPHGNPPVLITAPSIAGVPIVGQTLSVVPGTYSNAPSNVVYQWKLNGTGIFAAIDPIYTPVSGDVGGVVTVSEAASNAYGPAPVATSAGVTVLAAVSISGTPVLTGTESQTYAGFTVTGAGGVTPYAYSVSSGSLPTGLSLNTTTGAVSGTPSVPGAYAGIVLRATDSAGRFADLASFTITIAAAATGGGSGYLDYVPVLVL